MKTSKITEIAEIKTGYPFRGRVERSEKGNCRLVQMGDVRASNGEVREVPTQILLPDGPGKHVLQVRDVLFIARGTRNEAAVFVAKDSNAVAAPHFFVLRAQSDFVDPGYLACLLNLKQTQDQIGAIRTGSGIPFIPMSAFAEIKILLPDIKTQKEISSLYRLGLKEQQLLGQIKERRQTLVNSQLATIISGKIQK